MCPHGNSRLSRRETRRPELKQDYAFKVERPGCEVRDIRQKVAILWAFYASERLGTARAEGSVVTDDSVRQRQKLEAQVERWTAEAKKHAEAGKEAAALDLYCRAADELPGAPWLQHRTAELARKLKKNDVAINYFRRAATAFQIADFSKRAVAPLRTAWSLAVDGLPTTSKLLVELATELIQLHRRLGFAADATVTFERTNAALRTRGFSEIGLHVLESMQREPTGARLSRPPSAPSSEPPSSRPARAHDNSAPPTSNTVPRVSGSALGEDTPSTRSRALARLLERR
jgi:tetratricopeptide (TPR) repeat protein